VIFQYLLAIILCPFRVVYLFFHSMFFGNTYANIPQQRYETPTSPVTPQEPPQGFMQPGAVPEPKPSESV